MDYVVLAKCDGKYWLKLTKDHKIHGFKHETEGVRYFEDGYNSGHGRSYESSMSACIYFITFQPSIVGFATLDDLVNTLKISSESKIIMLQNVAGFMKAIDVDQEAAAKLWEKGIKPRLI